VSDKDYEYRGWKSYMKKRMVRMFMITGMGRMRMMMFRKR
jgi:hypothetical protein